MCATTFRRTTLSRKKFPCFYKGKGKLTLPFSAELVQISAPRSPARWLYPLKPGGEWKTAHVWRKTVTLIYPDPFYSSAETDHAQFG
jgi:hypothetical protein